jgi:hypothetical protein
LNAGVMQTPAFVWCMAMLVFKNRHQKHACYDEIGPSALLIDIILDVVVNTIGRAHVIG